MREPQELEYEFDGDTTKPCRVATGYADAGRQGIYFGKVVVNSRYWAVVLFDGEDDPDLYKLESIEVAEQVWRGA